MSPLWLVASLVLNVVFVVLVDPFSIASAPLNTATAAERHKLRCPRTWPATSTSTTTTTTTTTVVTTVTNGSSSPLVGARISKSPLSRGLRVGSHPVGLADILVVVPVAGHADAAKTWGAWADLLQPTASIEFVVMEDARTATPRQAPHPDSPAPLLVRSQPFADGRTAREVVWDGAETGKTTSLSAKLRRHWSWVAAVAAADPHYTSRKWFVKAETDTFLIPKHLLAMLSHLDPSRAVYAGKRLEGSAACGGGYASGALYALSRPALLALARGLELLDTPGEFEDAMVGCALERMNVSVTDVGNAIWHKRLWHRRETLGPTAAPLVAVHRTDDLCMLDFRALANIEFEHDDLQRPAHQEGKR
jgi:hypothetical protein